MNKNEVKKLYIIFKNVNIQKDIKNKLFLLN